MGINIIMDNGKGNKTFYIYLSLNNYCISASYQSLLHAGIVIPADFFSTHFDFCPNDQGTSQTTKNF